MVHELHAELLPCDASDRPGARIIAIVRIPVNVLVSLCSDFARELRSILDEVGESRLDLCSVAGDDANAK